MAIGPVQLLVLGFNHPDFHGEIIAELERLRESDTVRVIDSLAVYKDADGDLEVEHLSNLSEEEAIEYGTIKLKGTFPNTNHKLWPGQFVRVTLLLTTQANAVVVPNQAIQTGQAGAFIYVVKEDKKVEVRPVVAGARV